MLGGQGGSQPGNSSTLVSGFLSSLSSLLSSCFSFFPPFSSHFLLFTSFIYALPMSFICYSSSLLSFIPSFLLSFPSFNPFLSSFLSLSFFLSFLPLSFLPYPSFLLSFLLFYFLLASLFSEAPQLVFFSIHYLVLQKINKIK